MKKAFARSVVGFAKKALGSSDFISTCAEIGIVGLILPDVPYEEKEEFLPLCRRYGVDLISLIAPTSENRIAMIAKEAEGFLYIVSSLGVTGVRSEIKTDLASIIQVVILIFNRKLYFARIEVFYRKIIMKRQRRQAVSS